MAFSSTTSTSVQQRRSLAAPTNSQASTMQWGASGAPGTLSREVFEQALDIPPSEIDYALHEFNKNPDNFDAEEGSC